MEIDIEAKIADINRLLNGTIVALFDFDEDELRFKNRLFLWQDKNAGEKFKASIEKVTPGFDFSKISFVREANTLLRTMIDSKKEVFSKDPYKLLGNAFPIEAIAVLVKDIKIKEMAAFPLLFENKVRGIAFFITAVDYKNDKVTLLKILASYLEAFLTSQLYLSRAEQSAEKFKMVLEASPNIIFTLDTQGNHVYMSPCTQLVTAYSADEFFKKISKPESYVHEEDKEKVLNFYQEALKNKKGGSIDFRLVRKDNNVVWVSMWAKPLYDLNGSLIGLQGIEADITEHKKIENALKNSLDKFRALFEFAEDGIISFDLEGSMTEVNPAMCRMLGVARPDLIGKKVPDWAFVQDPEKARAARDFIERIGSLKEVAESQLEFRRKNGEEFAVHIVGGPLKDYNEEINGFIVVLTDISMIKQAEEEARKLREMGEKEQMQSEFMSVVSHELRTPVTPIEGYADILLAGNLGKLSDKQKDAVQKIKNQAKRMLYLIDSVLDLSKMQRGTLSELNRQETTVNELINEAVALLQHMVEENRIKINIDIAKGINPLSVDKAKMIRVFTNIVGNALKFSDKGGEIDIKVVAENDDLTVEIQDYGIGIQEKDLKFIFEKMYQADSSMTRKYGGMGIGLSVAKEVVLAHGGKIWAESPGLGKGTRVSFTIPLK